MSLFALFICLYICLCSAAITRDEYSLLKDLIPYDEPNHFTSMFAIELTRANFEESFDIRRLYENIEELSKIHHEFSELKPVLFPDIVAEPINDRLLFLKFEIEDKFEIDAKREVHIIQDIAEVASKEKNFLDLRALLLIKKEIKADINSSSKFKLFKTCLLAKLFPYMQTECETLFREKLAEHIKLWVEVWKRYNVSGKELDLPDNLVHGNSQNVFSD